MSALISIPRSWPGSTVACLGTGPSLCQQDVDFLRGKVRVIAVSNAWELAPWADVLYSCDPRWWKWAKGAPKFSGMKLSLDPDRHRDTWPGVQMLKSTGGEGLELAPTGLRTGHNSGYQAINLAVHFGAKRIVLLGYDMRGDHFFGPHPDGSKPNFHLCLSAFPTLVQPLKAAGVEIYNCTPSTAINAFPRATLAHVLPAALEVAS